ncbi:HAD-superfamily phosphatase [Ramicandelaber brevisporus]|nr:HAD-superfamily phosphatase [Ramicandelaber brevisporus]
MNTLRRLLRPALPHLVVNDVRSIDYAALRASGVTAIAFDKDNTLTAPEEFEVHPPFADAWRECVAVFGPENVLIVSNSAGLKSRDAPHYNIAAQTEQALNTVLPDNDAKITVLRHDTRKPGGVGELLQKFKDHKPEAICFVGDRLLTDVVYGNSGGCLTVWTRNIVTETREATGSAPMRKLESVVFDWMIGGGDKESQKKWQSSHTFAPLHPFAEKVALTVVKD